MRADNTIDPASAVTVIDVPTSRGQCCHVGGDIDFDAAGNLYLSTGDDTNPFDSAGYAPIDERADRNPAFDAQRTAGNSNDLRGKVLRIRPCAAGGYTIPAGNMFAPGTANTRPEVYAMGFRNPFRMSVDKATGVVYLGDYGPDAGTADPNRGPAGTVAFERITQPGFYGWPYCSNYNTPVPRVHVPQRTVVRRRSTAPAGRRTTRRNNTGITTLPPSRAGVAALRRRSGPAGPVLRQPVADGRPGLPLQPALSLRREVPAVVRRQVLRRRVRPAVDQDDRRQRRPAASARSTSFPWTGTQVMDMEFGPDGALYVLDYGTGWFGGDANSAVYRIEYQTTGGNRAPVAVGQRPTRPAARRR